MGMTQLGGSSKTTIFKLELDKLSEAFVAPLKKGTVTFSTDLITGNKVNMTVNGVAMAEKTFATDHATTMAAILVALKALSTVADATYSGDVITITPVDQSKDVLITNAYVSGGATIPTTITATVSNRVHQGQPVKFDSAGGLVPAAAGDAPYLIIGNAFQEQNTHSQAEITVIMKSHLTIIGQASGDTISGPVKYDGYDSTTGRMKFSDAAVTASNIAGWALENTSDGDEMRVAVVN